MDGIRKVRDWIKERWCNQLSKGSFVLLIILVASFFFKQILIISIFACILIVGDPVRALRAIEWGLRKASSIIND